MRVPERIRNKKGVDVQEEEVMVTVAVRRLSLPSLSLCPPLEATRISVVRSSGRSVGRSVALAREGKSLAGPDFQSK